MKNIQKKKQKISIKTAEDEGMVYLVIIGSVKILMDSEQKISVQI